MSAPNFKPFLELNLEPVIDEMSVTKIDENVKAKFSTKKVKGLGTGPGSSYYYSGHLESRNIHKPNFFGPILEL